MSITLTEKAVRVFEALVGRRSGIVRQVRAVPPIDGDARLEYIAATVANPHRDWAHDFRLACGGAGKTRPEALLAALGEGLERYLAGSYPRGGVLRRQAELDGPAIAPGELAPFSEVQRGQPGFPFQAVSAETPLRWVAGRRLSDGAACVIPASAVYLPYRPEEGEPLVGPGLSTGLACGESLDAALLHATCEVIERDAVALTWLGGLSPPQIDPAVIAELAGDVLPPADDVAAYDLTSDLGIPVVWVVCRGEGPSGRLLSVGSACRLDAAEALRKAAIEAAQDRIYVRQLLALEPKWRPADDFSNVSDFSYHARLYSVRPELIDAAFGFLSGSGRTTPHVGRLSRAVTDGLGSPSYVIERLARAGHDGAWVDLAPDWAAAIGMYVVRVVIPSLMPLHGHHGLAYLGHPRLARRREAKPHAEVVHAEPVWPYPHPFP